MEKYNHVTICYHYGHLKELMSYLCENQIIGITQDSKGLYTVVWWSYNKEERYDNTK